MTLTQIILRILDWCVQGVKGYIYGLLVEEKWSDRVDQDPSGYL